MHTAYFITHPEVVINSSVPVPDWPLSSTGLERMKRMLGEPWVSGVSTVFSSAEKKAVQAAQIMAGHLSLSPTVIDALGENDRSATGYLPKAEFEAVADAFFARPRESVRGWERAIDAQARIVRAVGRILSVASAERDIAIISHGGVGTLLLCHLKGVHVSRTEDQPGDGGGNVFSFDVATRRLLSGWQRIGEPAGAARF